MSVFDELQAHIQDAIRHDQSERLQIVVSFGCQPFTPDRDFHRDKLGGPLLRTSDGKPVKKPCPVCGRTLQTSEPPARSPESAFVICAGCDRGAPDLERRVRAKARAETQRQHRIQHNRTLTADTPIPAILLDNPIEPTAEPARKKPRRVRTLLQRAGLASV